MLEVFAQEVMSAHLHDTPELAPIAGLVEHRERSTERRRRAVQGRGNHWQPVGGLYRKPAISIGVLPGEFRDLGAGALAVAIDGQRAAVLEYRHHGRIGEYVLEPVFLLQ